MSGDSSSPQKPVNRGSHRLRNLIVSDSESSSASSQGSMARPSRKQRRKGSLYETRIRTRLLVTIRHISRKNG
ncbi:unnamed protein product [Nezara viridula]|uniref:Uncharacterized protein n=1 Tax=Nezara viridula TaxID=85310 RepID=A0A9P0E2A1_NEZVI|nr:unnamed protein product [Nezara viridula]